MDSCALCGNPSSRIVATSFHCDHGSSCRACVKLEELEMEIEETRKRLVSLIGKRPQLKYERNLQHDTLTKLPGELVSRIFQFCLVAQDVDKISRMNYRWYSFRATNTPFELAAVSQMWRSIATSAPELWTHVTFRMRKPHYSAAQKAYLEFAKNYLSRSGSLPLHFVILGPTHSEPMENGFSPLLDFFNTQSHRWRSLFLFISPSLIRRLIGNEKVSILDFLAIDSDSVQIGDFQLLGGIPTPNTVKLEGSAYLSVAINWAKVTHLTLHEAPLDRIFEIFRSATQLQSFRGTKLSRFYENPVYSTITHSDLQTLSLDDPSFQVDTLFEGLHLPSLSSLYLSNFRHMRPLVDWVHRWSCTIQNLTIQENNDNSSEHIIALLEACSSLETFKILDSQMARQHIWKIFERFTYPHNGAQPPFLPNLRNLHLLGYHADVPWWFIPHIFIPSRRSSKYLDTQPLEHLSEDSFVDHQRHDLHFDIKVKRSLSRDSDLYIPQDAIASLLEVREKGFKLDICHADHSGQDFLLLSAKHFGM